MNFELKQCVTGLVLLILTAESAKAVDNFRGNEWINPHSDDEFQYVVSSDRLEQVRSEKMYPFFDKGGNDGNGDFQLNIRDTQPQINKQLNFLLPFYGFGFNYTWLSLHGYISFSNIPHQFPEYPLSFPVQEWPRVSDPSFIGIFYSRCKVGQLNGNEEEEYARRRPGVYFRLERDLYWRKDQFGVELRERAKWDIRESMVGSETFLPKHIVIATWKNVSFAGGIPSATRITNTFQSIIVTDEVRTYAIFIYEWMGWTTHTEAGGDTTTGQGGVPAFVGFNAGNGTKAYEYLPYSQTTLIRDLPGYGGANGFPGRHIFRIDENIIPGVCIRDLIGTNLPLSFAPENGNMLGGTMVNMTGPCFLPKMRVTCRFNTKDSEGVVLNENRASCIMPWTEAEGWVDFELSLDGGPFYWKGKFYVEPPSVSPPLVWFEEDTFHQLDPGTMILNWDWKNLTMNFNAKVSISLWGYLENHIEPELLFIDDIEPNTNNDGLTTLNSADFYDRDNGEYLRQCEFGFIMINLTNPVKEIGMKTSPKIWSRPMPLGWYFSEQWRRFEGNNWVEKRCDLWTRRDRLLKYFTNELPMCPCLLRQAIVDRGRYAPDFDCDQDGNTQCYYHQGSQHCVVTSMPNHDGSGQQCCYDLAGYLMLSADNKWGGTPFRVHGLGVLPWNEANKIPSLSHWLHDKTPFYTCCLWQDEQSKGCQHYRFERRSSQDCVGYQPPGGATVFGDPHIYTFDGLEYTFNGKGEFVLVRADTPRVKLDVQGRFESIFDSPYGKVDATALTAIAAKDNFSSIVEVRLRPRDAQWRYKLDVLVDSQPIYFDRYPQKIQHFPGVTVYTPSNILNQSHVVIMFQSGAGVEVLENKHYMAARVYLPWQFINQTRGLFGNWTFDVTDDFTLPGGKVLPRINVGDLKRIHNDFAINWVLHDKEALNIGRSLFHHGKGRSSNFYYSRSFEPEWEILPEIPENVTWVDMDLAIDTCGESYQCKYDYATTLSKEFAIFTKYYQDQFINIREGVLKPAARVVSCGALPTPPNGRKSTFAFTPGTMVKFDCDPGYVLTGERRRWCYDNGDWNWAEMGEAQCVDESSYTSMRAGLTAGIVMAILLPLIGIGICLFALLRSRGRNSGRRIFQVAAPPVGHFEPQNTYLEEPYLKSSQTVRMDYKKPHGIQKDTLLQSEEVPSSFERRGRLRQSTFSPGSHYSLHENESSIDSEEYDENPYEVYYTHEPLANRPNIDIPRKVMDIDIDISKYKSNSSQY
eukprot:TRINITY_DN996_c0_g2_i3.p1 TRINITY_DN996_c0_g2~~TRINITY_DN996_c0_g2_i3.p1  ORF type:complete len:1255 (-),score=221.80 TRINITY_DN996_c0_g2_i3:184-3948(-)